MTQIYLVRHCESLSNRYHSFAGRADMDISAKGKLQLECLSEYFKDKKIDKIYTSPLIRARKTAEAINKYHDCEIEIDDAFIEINLGELDGRPVSDMTDEQIFLWNMQPHKFYVKGGETMEQVANRAYEGILRIVRENPNSTVAIASHGCVIRNLMRIFKGFAFTGLNEVDWCDNTGVNLIEADGDNFFVETENFIGHLSEDAAAVPITSWLGEDE